MSRIIIVGAGVVGGTTGKGFARLGHDVSFVDIDPARVESLRAEGYKADERLELGAEDAIIFVTLPTPNDGYRWDLGSLTAGLRSIGEAIRESNAFHTVVMRSTVPPGTNDGLLRPLLEKVSGKRVGEGFALGANPEFLRARCAVEDFLYPWMTVVASRSPRTLERLEGLFEPFGGELRRFTDPTAAEMVKCAHNLFNATKISFWNEMWLAGRKLDVDVDAVSTTVARSAEGSLNPEYGIAGGGPYGGACLPKDTKGFLGFAYENGLEPTVLAAVDAVNERMKHLADNAAAGEQDLAVDLREVWSAVETAGNGARS